MSPNTTAFQCQMCGTCCRGEGGIIVDRTDLQRLAAFLELSQGQCAATYTHPQGEKLVLQCASDGLCVFFRHGQGCSVHAVKPAVCRAWPFFRGNLLDPLSWELAQDACPGIYAQAGHAAFVRQGWAYLCSQGLLRPRRADTANALIVTAAELPYAID
ncbi:MAG: YkgJ family cysteine cluster protein [Desulfohalobium sp.]